MKTYKLCQLTYMDQNIEKEFSLLNGLIINKEDEGANWIIEALMEKSQLIFFQNCFVNQTELQLRATITTTDNNPVPFIASVRTVEELNGKTHVLLNAARGNISPS